MERIRWASKVPQKLIWDLYQSDAAGLLDEDLLADVGFRLYHRCRCNYLVTRREVECPRCGAVFALRETAPWRFEPGLNTCPTPECGWQFTAEQWHDSWKHRDLLGSAAVPAIETYLRDYPRAKTPQARMLCIDQLIHAFHISLQSGKLNRAFANNLIEGSHEQVIALLDRLAARPGTVDKDQWRADVETMFKRRQGKD